MEYKTKYPYYTDFEIKTEPPLIDTKIFLSEDDRHPPPDCRPANIVLKLGNDGADRAQHNQEWSSYKEDMNVISKRYPTTLFIVDGKGHGITDTWRMWVMNGKAYKWTLPSIETLAPPFDSDKLQ